MAKKSGKKVKKTKIATKAAQPARSKKNPLASIVILTLNNLDYTKQCIESVFKYSPRNIEVIVVDNGSTDETPTYLKSLQKKDKRIRVILNEKNLGFAKGNNQGIEKSEGDYIVLLNNDTVVTDGWLDRMIAVSNCDPFIGMVGPSSNYVSGPQFLTTFYGHNMSDMHKYARKLAGNFRTDYLELKRLVGFCLLIKREVVEKIGLLDEQFELGNFEDDDLCLRAIEAGYKLVWSKGTFIHHWGSRTFASEGLDYTKLLRENQEKFRKKWDIEIKKEPPPVSQASDQYYEFERPEVADLVPFGVERVLDVGCGAGVFGESLKAKGIKEVMGIEFNPDAARKAEMRLDGILVGDVETVEIPWPKKYFDYISVNDVLEHLRDPWNTLLKLKEYLKDDGFLVGSIPNISHISIITGLLSGRWTYQDAGILDRTHLRFFTIPEARKMIEDAGFEITDTRVVADNPNPAAEKLASFLPEMGIENESFLADSNVIQLLFVAKNKIRTLSLTMIVRNEEILLPRCLESVKDVVDEIIVVDTGSTDHTIEIAKSFGAKVIEHEWKGDFSEARNVSLDAATGDWVMFLDADEEIVPEDRERLRGLLTENEYEGFHFSIVSLLGYDKGVHSSIHRGLRMWRNRPEYRFHGPIHEQIIDRFHAREGKIKLADVRIKHAGYLLKTVLRQDKMKRNIEIVKQTVKENPDSCFAHYNLAMEYLRYKENEKALEEFKKAFKKLPSLDYNFAPQIVLKLAATLANLGQTNFDIIHNGMDAYPTFTDLMFLKGQIFIGQNDYEEAQKCFEECLKMGDCPQLFQSEVGVGSHKALYMLGEVFEKRGQTAESVLAYSRAFQDNPRFYPALHKLGRALLDGEDVESVRLFFEKNVDLSSFENLIELAEMFANSGHPDIGLSYLDMARKIRRNDPLLDYKCGQLQMLTKNYAEARKLFDRVPRDHELAEAAALARVLGDLLQRDYAAAKKTLSKLDGDDRRVTAYSHLVALFSGELSPLDVERGKLPAVSDEVTSMFWSILSQFSALKEYELFEKTLPLLRSSALPEGLIALNLGKIYHEAGASDLAAEQFISALQNNFFDVDSLVILGIMAEKAGLQKDAEDFYRAAIECGPKNLRGYSNLLSLLIRGNSLSEAQTVVKEAQKHFPDSKLLIKTAEKLKILAQSSDKS